MEAKNLVELFFQEYLVHRNYDNLMACLDEQVTWFGTGKGEVCSNLEEAGRLLKEDLEQLDTHFNITKQTFFEEKVNHHVFVVWGTFSAETYFEEERIALDDVRISAVCRQDEKPMRIIHFHTSFASVEQKENEFYPLESTKRWMEQAKQLDDKDKLYASVKRKYLKVLDDNKQLYNINNKLKVNLSKDGLTGLLNRTYILKRLEVELARCYYGKLPLVFMMLDLDYFKKVNDTYGHMIGDQVLIQGTALFQEKIGRLGYVGRYGGEEFCAILANKNEAEGAQIAETIRQAFEAESFTDEKIKVTVSIGVCIVTSELDNQKVIEQADRLLYEAKNTGRNKVCIGGQIEWTQSN